MACLPHHHLGLKVPAFALEHHPPSTEFHHKPQEIWAVHMVQLVKYLSCSHEDLSSVPKSHVLKKSGMGVLAGEQVWGDRHKIPEDSLASQSNPVGKP